MSIRVRSAATAVIATLLFGTSTITALWPARPAVAATVRPAKDVLTQSDAVARSKVISQVTYDLRFTFEPDADHYSGQATIRFACADRSGDLTLDYAGKRVSALMINGKSVPLNYNQAYITLPAASLQAQNTVSVTFDSAFDTGGTGMTRFVDPADQRTYIYSDFEPYGAHHLFPCFDQPDLKATFTTTVDAPLDWEVIGNVAPKTQTPSGGRRETVFDKTPPLSTYLFALHTGQYVSWHAMAGTIPMGLYARASLAKFVDTENLFTITRQGLSFYGKYFDYTYPFGKYDQVFSPELPEGAMENPGAVTLNEDQIYRHKVTDSERYDRDDTIVHEMAHMWFGDLVTMSWWNDLWLNESFATYMAAVCKDSLPPRYGDSWSMFFKTKEWAYDTDDRVTTHPIEARIADTNAATENFDGITYGKGASGMKQLAFYIGPDAFREGVRTYFKRHAYGNTTLKDFMAALQTQTPHDLGAWTHKWLQSAGLNAVEPSVQTVGGKISLVTLAQESSSGDNTPRPHRTQIGLYDEGKDGKLRLRETVPATYDGPKTTVDVLKGKPTAPLMFVNVQDQDYAKVRLDGTSLRTVKEKLSAIEDPFVRQQLWSVLWYMVRDQKLDVISYIDLLQRHMPAETALLVVESQLHRLDSVLDQDLDAKDRVQVGAMVEPFVWTQLNRQPEGSDTQLLWAGTLIDVSRSTAGLDRLYGLLRGTVVVPGLDVNQDMRWQIIRELTACGHPQADTAFTSERLTDTTDRGLKAADRVRAARPDAAVKEQIWKQVLTDRKASLSQLEASMDGFADLSQAKLLKPFERRFFDGVAAIYQDREPGFASSFYKRLYPLAASAEVLTMGEQLLRRTDLSPELRRKLQESNQDMKRRLRLQERAKQVLAARGRPAGH